MPFANLHVSGVSDAAMSSSHSPAGGPSLLENFSLEYYVRNRDALSLKEIRELLNKDSKTGTDLRSNSGSTVIHASTVWSTRVRKSLKAGIVSSSFVQQSLKIWHCLVAQQCSKVNTGSHTTSNLLTVTECLIRMALSHPAETSIDFYNPNSAYQRF